MLHVVHTAIKIACHVLACPGAPRCEPYPCVWGPCGLLLGYPWRVCPSVGLWWYLERSWGPGPADRLPVWGLPATGKHHHPVSSMHAWQGVFPKQNVSNNKFYGVQSSHGVQVQLIAFQLGACQRQTIVSI
eukprot:1160409-Pelagomonas_calceolata.AAC.2